MEREKLEEASEKYSIHSFNSQWKDVNDHFEAGAKWQQEIQDEFAIKFADFYHNKRQQDAFKIYLPTEDYLKIFKEKQNE